MAAWGDHEHAAAREAAELALTHHKRLLAAGGKDPAAAANAFTLALQELSRVHGRQKAEPKLTDDDVWELRHQREHFGIWGL